MGSPPAKELLPQPESGQPLIRFSLDRARDCDASPVVITRRDKHALVAALEEWGIESYLIDASREWPDTLLQSEPVWGERNLVLLPDTTFEPTSMAAALLDSLSETDIAFATFPVVQPEVWGMFGSRNGRAFVAEKPRTIPEGLTARAWGLFAFRREAGRTLLRAMLESGADHSFHEVFRAKEAAVLTRFTDHSRPAA